MDTKGSFFYGFLLLLLIQLQPSRANPIYSLSPAKELASMEALLERLEDKFAMMEALESNPDLQEPKAQEEILPELTDDGDNQKAEPRLAPNTPLSYREPLLKRLRGLQMPRMMRDSGCFGRRIDRIGSLSGMGCNGESWLSHSPNSTDRVRAMAQGGSSSSFKSLRKSFRIELI
ncbi:natriuretic peptides A-like [Melozone crissalis]|uniref:natriuretic peptides A-like n=1 Tax=Melozone crissalis TaxID=40204 RepID=UPI0023DB6445|nr:natriuretic peptides A-like [Melozone crissalis]